MLMHSVNCIVLHRLALSMAAAISILAAMPGPSFASGDRALGEYLSSECTTCHQVSGRQQGGIPAIVGWPEDQLVAVMHSYQQKHRENVTMQTIAARLSPAELAALASYFGSLKPIH